MTTAEKINTGLRDALIAERMRDWPSTLKAAGYCNGLDFAIKLIDPEWYDANIGDES